MTAYQPRPLSSAPDTPLLQVLERAAAHFPVPDRSGLVSVAMPLDSRAPWPEARSFSYYLSSPGGRVVRAGLAGQPAIGHWDRLCPTDPSPFAFLALPFRHDGQAPRPWVPAIGLQRAGGVVTAFFTAPAQMGSDQAKTLWRHAMIAPAMSDPFPADWSDLDQDQWQDRVRRALMAIQDGQLSKIVLTRTQALPMAGPPDFDLLLARLRQDHPQAAVLMMARHGRRLVAASPEPLVALHGDRLCVDALAGTLPAHCPAQDLANSAKDRLEHDVVVRDLAQGLADLCVAYPRPGPPLVKTLPGLHHLWTPMGGAARPGITLAQAMARLHPTPALAGWPRQAALDLLDSLGEKRDFGYCWALGCTDPQGQGDSFVAIRSAGFRAGMAVLSAGAGIVAGSDPAREWQETEWKMDTMRQALSHP